MTLYAALSKGVAMAALLAALASAMPAHAQQQVLRDPGGDVWRAPFGSPPVPVRGRAQDLRGALVRHGEAVITLQWRYAVLRPRGRLVVHRALLRTGDGAAYEARVEAGPGSRSGEASVFQGDALVQCSTRHRIDHVKRRVRLRVPRTCLGDPLSLQARLDAYAGLRDGSFRRDDAHDSMPQTDL